MGSDRSRARRSYEMTSILPSTSQYLQADQYHWKRSDLTLVLPPLRLEFEPSTVEGRFCVCHQ